jgi:GTP cyclohydrolase II
MSYCAQNDNIILNFERSLFELKAGLCVVINIEGVDYLFASVEKIQVDIYNKYFLHDKNSKLILSQYRAKFLNNTLNGAIFFNIPQIKYLNHKEIIGLEEGNNIHNIHHFAQICNENISNLLLNIMKFIQTNPAVYFKIANKKEKKIFLNLKEDDFVKYSYNKNQIRLNSSAEIYVKGNNKARIVTFSSLYGLHEYYAIVLNENMQNNNNNSIVRIHSSCFTGDIANSMMCDCRDQLQLAIDFIINSKSHGIIIYLLQEGRGIGLANKLRAYNLQKNGYDTIQANKYLGFPTDDRDFAVASNILNLLNITNISLITNNPEKINFFSNTEIKVNSIIQLPSVVNNYNKNYLETKKQELNHSIIHY